MYCIHESLDYAGRCLNCGVSEEQVHNDLKEKRFMEILTNINSTLDKILDKLS